MPGAAPGPPSDVFTHDATDCRPEHDDVPSARRNENNNTGQTDLLPAAIGHTRDFAPQMIRSNNSGS